MEQPAASAQTSPSFAGLLAALAARTQGSSPAWNDDGLEDDIATLSYERALRTHTRYGSAGTSDRSLTQAADRAPIRLEQASQPSSAAVPRAAARSTAEPERAANPEPQPNRPQAAPFERNLKQASITIRMSRAECVQLHRRAAEAGLTVSAYLRSCTVEAESLRAMVKETLAQLRSVQAPAEPSSPAAPRRSRFRWLARVFPP